MANRLAAIKDGLDAARSIQDVAKLMIIFGEGMHTEYILGVEIMIRWPVVGIHLQLSQAPWTANFFTRIQ